MPPNQKKINFQQTRSFGEKINATFEFIAQNFKPLLKCLIYITGPFLLITGFFLGLYFDSYTAMMPELLEDPDSGPPFGFLADMGIYMAGLTISSILGSVMIVTTTYEYVVLYQERPELTEITVEEVWKDVKRDFLMVFITMIGLSVVIIFGFLFFILPGLILAIFLSIIYIVQIKERVGFSKAFSRSISLVSGKWWSTFGLLIITGLIQSSMGFVFMIPTYSLLVVDLMHTVDPGLGYEADQSILNQVFYILTSIIYSLGASLLYAIPLIALAFQYYNLVERKEASGLMEQIQSMSTPEGK